MKKGTPGKRNSFLTKNNLLTIGGIALVVLIVLYASVSGLLNPNATKSLFASSNSSSLLGYAAGWNWVIPAQAPPNVQASTPIWTALGTNGTQCFLPSDTGNLPFKVLQQTPGPVYPSTYKYYPLTMAAAEGVESFPETQGVDDYFFLWANRCDTQVGSQPGNINQCVGNDDQAGNPLLQYNVGEGSSGQNTFKSYKAADDCTLAQESASFGANLATINSYIAGDGLTLLTSTSTIQNLINDNQLHNDCYVFQATPQEAAANKGVFLDYEVGDNRTDSMATAFLQQVVTMAHNNGKVAILYTNPLNAPFTAASGIDSNDATSLLNTFDSMSILLYGANKENNITASFNDQLQIFKNGSPNVNFSHLMITFDVGDTAVADAQTVHSLMYQYNIPLMTIFRDGAQQGGMCSTLTNQKLLCLLYAQCGGTPPNPPPTATLTANTPNILLGQSSTFTYACTNSTASYLTTFGALSPIAGGTTAARAPKTTTSYSLTCRGAGGTATSTATVNVNTALPDLTSSLVPGTTPINQVVNTPVKLEAYVANIGAGPTGQPFEDTFFVDFNGQPYTQLEFPSGDPGPGNPPPGGFAAGIKEIDGPQVPIEFTPTQTGHYSFRVCADRTANMTQTVPQSNTTNDCSAWGGINIRS